MLEFVERYRLQCDRFEAMWLMVKELSGRLNSHFNRGKNDNFSLYFASQLPLQEYFDLIDAHFEVRAIFILGFQNTEYKKKHFCLQGKCVIFLHGDKDYLGTLTYFALVYLITLRSKIFTASAQCRQM